MNKQYEVGIVWLRRDLRIQDNCALHQALLMCHKILCVFVFDTEILQNLPVNDKRITFIYECLHDIQCCLDNALVNKELTKKLILFYGKSTMLIPYIATKIKAQAVFVNHDDELYATTRDAQVRQTLQNLNITLHSFKDHVIFEKKEVLSKVQSVYTVFTPYKKAWLAKFAAQKAINYTIDVEDFIKQYLNIDENFYHELHTEQGAFSIQIKPHIQYNNQNIIFNHIGFETQNLLIKGGEIAAQKAFADFCKRINAYQERRDFPSIKGVSYLSTHLRFGSISIRQLVNYAYKLSLHDNNIGASTWLGELIWRDFFAQILANFPHIQHGKSFNEKYDAIVWRTDAQAQDDFAKWCSGETGFPIIDAAMKQLNSSGYMHNRLRMITACFLIKNMGIDWRWGEEYFAQKLLDFDLASNNGGWQWCASTGCDAQPYFRIFNPMLQSVKFDKEGRFIQKYIPYLAALNAKDIHAPWEASSEILQQAGIILGKNYPNPIVDYKSSRDSTLQRYKAIQTTHQ